MKILYLVSTLKNSGPTNQLSYIIQHLDRNFFEPVILTLSEEPEDSRKPFFVKDLNVQVYSLSLSRLKGLLLAKKRVYDFILLQKVDIVHSQGIRADNLLKGMAIPKLLTIRNFPFIDYPLKFGRIKGYLMALKHFSSIKKEKSNVIACSKTIANLFSDKGFKVDFIHNGVNTDLYKPLSVGQVNELKNKLNIPDNYNKVFISVGSLIERKDMRTVIDGFIKFNKNKNNILLIVGDGPDKESLQKSVGQDVLFLGKVSNVVEYLQISDCFISAALAEGLPDSVLEAMACGLPVVLSNIPSHKELFQDEEGVFFPVKQVSDLSGQLERINKNMHKYADISFRLINSYYRAEVMSGKYQNQYRKRI
ncbi:MAG: glycosyltransferase family 4 protein [Bacteroidota bacterium]